MARTLQQLFDQGSDTYPLNLPIGVFNPDAISPQENEPGAFLRVLEDGVAGWGELTAADITGLDLDINEVIGDSILDAEHGGTGIGSYTIGDLIVAVQPDELGVINDVVTGRALFSTGIGSIPAYRRITAEDVDSGTFPGTADYAFNAIVRPSTDNTRNLGTATFRWRGGFFGTEVVIGTDPTGSQALRIGGELYAFSTAGSTVNTGTFRHDSVANPLDVLAIQNLDNTAATFHNAHLSWYFVLTGQTTPVRAFDIRVSKDVEWVDAATTDANMVFRLARNGSITNVFRLRAVPTNSTFLAVGGYTEILTETSPVSLGLVGFNVQTNLADKQFYIGVPHYSGGVGGTEEAVVGIGIVATSGVNTVRIGGGSSVGNTVTVGQLYAAADSITVTGTVVAQWDITALFPGADNVYTLGKTGSRWSIGYFGTKVLIGTQDASSYDATAVLTTEGTIYSQYSAGGFFTGTRSTVPTINQNLGGTTYRAFDGVGYAFLGGITVAAEENHAVGAQGVRLQFSTAAIGTAAAVIKWRMLGAGTWVPHVDNTYDIGQTAVRVRAIYSYEGNFKANVTFDNGTADSPGLRLVSTTNTWEIDNNAGALRFFVAPTVYMSLTTTALTVTGNINPGANDTYNLGVIGTGWKQLVIQHNTNRAEGILLNQTLTTAQSPRLFFNNSTDFPGAANAIFQTASNTLTFTTGATIGSASGTRRWHYNATAIYPETDNAYALGTTGLRFNNVFGYVGNFTTSVTIGTTVAATGNPRLDIVGDGTQPVSALVGATSSTDATAKFFNIALRHYTNSEEPVHLIGGESRTGLGNISFVRIGGGSASFNAVMSGELYAAANNTTVTGTLILGWSTSGLFPGADNTYDIGNSSTRFRELFVLTIDSGASDLTIQRNNVTKLTVLNAETRFASGNNIAFFGTGSFGTGTNVVSVLNASVVPSTNPTGGGILYAEGGAGKWRGSGGTITTFGPAEPHCQRCKRDFAVEWENELYGKLSICMWCLSDILPDVVIEKRAA